MSTPQPLGLLLVEAGLITRDQLYAALRLQRADGRRLGGCLVSLGYIAPGTLLGVLSDQLGLPALPPGRLAEIGPAQAHLLDAELAEEFAVVPFDTVDGTLCVAMADGTRAPQMSQLAARVGRKVRPHLALEAEIEAARKHVYGTTAAVPTAGPPPPAASSEHPHTRPQRIEPVTEKETSPLGDALGIDGAPILLIKKKKAKPRAVGPPAKPPNAVGARSALFGAAPDRDPVNVVEAVPAPAGASQTPTRTLDLDEPSDPIAEALQNAPTPAPTAAASLNPQGLDALPFREAVEDIYRSDDVDNVGRACARGLGAWFERVFVFSIEGDELRALGYLGAQPGRHLARLAALPGIAQSVHDTTTVYGVAREESYAAELCDTFDIAVGKTALLAFVQALGKTQLLLYADNGADPELYDELPEVELLLKETETALGALVLKTTAPIPLPT